MLQILQMMRNTSQLVLKCFSINVLAEVEESSSEESGDDLSE